MPTIVGIVAIATVVVELCAKDRPELAQPLKEAFDSWSNRNEKYVKFANADANFAPFKKQLLEQRPEQGMPEEKCSGAVRTMSSPLMDIDYLRANKK